MSWTYEFYSEDDMRETLPGWAVKGILDLAEEEMVSVEDEGVYVRDMDRTFHTPPDSVFEVYLGGAEFLLIVDDETAFNVAVEEVENMIADEGAHLFNQSFLINFLEVAPADARMIGVDEADAYVGDLDEYDLIEEAERYAREHAGAEVDRLERLLGEYEDAEKADDYDTMEKLEDFIRDLFMSLYADEVERKVAEDPVGYFVEELGAYTIDELVEQPFIRVDEYSLARAAVRTDGEAHFLARYDGYGRDLDGGSMAYRYN